MDREEMAENIVANNMTKRYAIYLNDNPYDPMYCDAKNKTEARKAGRLYIRQWALHTTIDRIEEA